MEFSRKICGDCKKFVKAERDNAKKINHLLHLVLSVLTGGLWVIVWILLALTTSKESWYCSQCGSDKLYDSKANYKMRRKSNKILSSPMHYIIVIVFILIMIGIVGQQNY